jgi:ribosomal-protein-alanine N-acetyltransferase
LYDIKVLEKEKFIDLIYKMELKIFSDPWTKKMIKNEFNSKLTLVLGIFNKNNKELVGYSFLFMVYDEIHINNFAVKKSFRRQKLGLKLLEYIIEYSKTNNFRVITLEARPSNTAAGKGDSKGGGKKGRMRRNYYSNPKEDAVVMVKEIKEI